MAHVVIEVPLTPEEWAWLMARADYQGHPPDVEAGRLFKQHIGTRVRGAAKERARIADIELQHPPRTRGRIL